MAKEIDKIKEEIKQWKEKILTKARELVLIPMTSSTDYDAVIKEHILSASIALLQLQKEEYETKLKEKDNLLNIELENMKTACKMDDKEYLIEAIDILKDKVIN